MQSEGSDLKLRAEDECSEKKLEVENVTGRTLPLTARNAQKLGSEGLIQSKSFRRGPARRPSRNDPELQSRERGLRPEIRSIKQEEHTQPRQRDAPMSHSMADSVDSLLNLLGC
jgi:hypothetical protein